MLADVLVFAPPPGVAILLRIGMEIGSICTRLLFFFTPVS